MLSWFILGVALLVSALLILRWASTADPRTLVRVLKWVLIGLVVLLALVFVLTGRAAWALAGLPVLFPVLLRLITAWRAVRNFSRMANAATGGSTGRTSSIRTRVLDMTLDHDSGAMSGRVLDGPLAGQDLDGLAPADLIDLMVHCRAVDGQSVQVLEAYLEREHPHWRDWAGAGAGAGEREGEETAASAGAGAMTRDEAFRVLGLEPGAEAAAVKAAHRRLMAALHPDRGGSDYLASKINQAKDVLLS